MLTQQDINDAQNTLSYISNDDLTSYLAYMSYAETKNPDLFWSMVFNKIQGSYDKVRDAEDLKDIKNLFWIEAQRRGITLAEVQSRIGQLTRMNEDEVIKNIKSDSGFINIISEKLNKNNTKKIITNIIWVIVIITAIFLLYKYVFKGKLGVA